MNKRYSGFIALCLMVTGFALNAPYQVQAQALPEPISVPDVPGVWGDIVYGDPDAPVELIEYGSLTCSHCASFSKDVLPRLQADFIESGKLRFVFRNFIRDRYDLAGAAASRCLTDEKATKQALENLFAEQEAWLSSENAYVAIGEIVGRQGLSQEDYGKCLSDQTVQKHLVEMRQVGIQLYDIKSIPTLVLDGNAFSFPGYDMLKLRIESAILAVATSSKE
jgi:protein-disulfide isomerase